MACGGQTPVTPQHIVSSTYALPSLTLSQRRGVVLTLGCLKSEKQNHGLFLVIPPDPPREWRARALRVSGKTPVSSCFSQISVGSGHWKGSAGHRASRQVRVGQQYLVSYNRRPALGAAVCPEYHPSGAQRWAIPVEHVYGQEHMKAHAHGWQEGTSPRGTCTRESPLKEPFSSTG